MKKLVNFTSFVTFSTSLSVIIFRFNFSTAERNQSWSWLNRSRIAGVWFWSTWEKKLIKIAWANQTLSSNYFQQHTWKYMGPNSDECVDPLKLKLFPRRWFPVITGCILTFFHPGVFQYFQFRCCGRRNDLRKHRTDDSINERCKMSVVTNFQAVQEAYYTTMAQSSVVLTELGVQPKQMNW